MAYSIDQWERAKAYYTAGLSLREIESKTGINNSSIQKKAKNQQWKHGENVDYIEARQIIAEKKSAENSALIQVLDDIADEAIRNKTLVYGIQTKLLNKIETMADQIDTPQDAKTLVDAVDRASITLKVSERFAPKGDVNIQTNTQVNNAPLEIKFVD